VLFIPFFTCGSYLGWAFGPIFPSWLFLDPVLRGKLPRDPSGVGGTRHSVVRVSTDGRFHLIGRDGCVMGLDCPE